jgi:ribokinase
VSLAVVGHVEWCTFLRVERLPRPGEIVHVRETWEEPGGGGGVAAAELVRRTGAASLYTALGDDRLGRRTREALERLGVTVYAPPGRGPQRRAVVFLDDLGERTIAVVGAKLRPKGDAKGVPWGLLAAADGVFFVSGDVAALRASRGARVLVATPRELPIIRAAGVELDALVGSGDDEGERYRPGELDPPPRLVVSTAGALGGWAQPGGPFRPAQAPARFEDAYGAGDSFAAGLTCGLARGLGAAAALALAAEWGAGALARRGAGASAAAP